MSTFTASKNLERVANAADVGTWDTPTNSNWSVVDAALGQSVTIGLNNSNVVLSSPQYQCAQIIFNSTLTASVTISFPSTFTGPYMIQNLCTGTSAFTITLQTTIAGGQVVACPQGDSFNAINDGTNLKYHNFGRVGSYWDYAGSSVPNWVSACTVAPYLNCDGTAFSSATFPALAQAMGGTTLPDSRGNTKAALNQGTARMGAFGNTFLNIGGAATTTLVTGNLPAYTPSGSNALNNGLSVQGANNNTTSFSNNAGGGNIWVAWPSGTTATVGTVLFTGNAQGGVSTPFNIIQPCLVHGLTLIRSA